MSKKYTFEAWNRNSDNFGFKIMEDGHTMFPEDIVMKLNQLNLGEYYYLFYQNHDNDFIRLYDVLSDVLHIEGCKREIKRKAVHPENVKFFIIKGSQIAV